MDTPFVGTLLVLPDFSDRSWMKKVVNRDSFAVLLWYGLSLVALKRCDL